MVKKFINVENEKIFPIGDIWNDIFFFYAIRNAGK